jgi:hypothetical protein
MTRTNAKQTSLQELDADLTQPATRDVFHEDELNGLPAPVQRYFRASIAPGTPLALAARLEMHGSIKLGGRWLPSEPARFLRRTEASSGRRASRVACSWAAISTPRHSG